MTAPWAALLFAPGAWILAITIGASVVRAQEGSAEIGVPAAVGQTVDPRTVPGDSVILELHSSFGANLHQFLYAQGRMRAGYADTARQAISMAARDTIGVGSMRPAERAAWNAAVTAYADSLSAAEMWSMGPANAAMARWSEDRPPPERLPANVRATLPAAASVYRRVWWPRHDSLNLSWIREQIPLVERHGPGVSRRLSSAFLQPWPADTIPVEVTAYATWAGAFTTEDPLLVHVSTTYAAHRGSGGLEQLHHEAGHAIVEPIFEALRAEVERQGLIPRRGAVRDLWHALLFHTAGYAVREVVPDHVPYAEEWGVEERNREAFAALRGAWDPWLRGEVDFERAIRDLVGRMQWQSESARSSQRR